MIGFFSLYTHIKIEAHWSINIELFPDLFNLLEIPCWIRSKPRGIRRKPSHIPDTFHPGEKKPRYARRSRHGRSVTAGKKGASPYIIPNLRSLAPMRTVCQSEHAQGVQQSEYFFVLVKNRFWSTFHVLPPYVNIISHAPTGLSVKRK